ncbi:MAG: DUF3348 domain-containing protein [Pseudomonadales bacterium]|nr:DUF3348 domain-containing protein [Pseudomonadales bacterium]
MNQSEGNTSKRNFGDRLGSLIDFSDSILLAATHGQLKGLVFEKRTTDVSQAKNEFLTVREQLVETIIKSTSPQVGGTRIKLPDVHAATLKEQRDFDSYHRFYASHQRNMDGKIKNLRLALRDEVSGFSPSLAQLAVLDTSLDDTLATHSRRFFNSIPKLLSKHYKRLLAEQIEQLGEEALATEWLNEFYKDLQALLLAELEVRLQPVLGLLEALNGEVNNR